MTEHGAGMLRSTLLTLSSHHLCIAATQDKVDL